jgi:hypothetical protein
MITQGFTYHSIYKYRSLLVFCLLFVLTFILLGCGNYKNISQAPDPKVLERPTWIDERPHNSAYYIGIGSCSKTSQPTDYQMTAKKNALNDLATEISVRVQGSTFLNTLEVNKNFSEEFISTISTTTDEKIENYEIAGTWEDKNVFWVYYRVNKAEYQRLKQEKKNQILSTANDYYTKGKDAEAVQNIPASFDLYMRGLISMKEYWDEVNEFNSGGKTVYLDNEIFQSLQRITAGLRLKSGVQKIILSSDNSFAQSVPVQVQYQDKSVRGLTLNYNFKKDTFSKPKTSTSNDLGEIAALVSEVSKTDKENFLTVTINLDALLANDLDRTMQQGLIKSLKPDQLQIPIQLMTPSFFVKSTEKTFGRNAGNSSLASVMNSELVKQGMRMSNSQTESNYTVDIVSNTTAGGTSQGFTVAYLEMSITVSNSLNGEVVYKEVVDGIKGLQLNQEAAGVEAYKKAKEKLEVEIVRTIVNAII